MLELAIGVIEIQGAARRNVFHRLRVYVGRHKEVLIHRDIFIITRQQTFPVFCGVRRQGDPGVCHWLCNVLVGELEKRIHLPMGSWVAPFVESSLVCPVTWPLPFLDGQADLSHALSAHREECAPTPEAHPTTSKYPRYTWIRGTRACRRAGNVLQKVAARAAGVSGRAQAVLRSIVASESRIACAMWLKIHCC